VLPSNDCCTLLLLLLLLLLQGQLLVTYTLTPKHRVYRLMKPTRQLDLYTSATLSLKKGYVELQ
jgi:hypothetical protein